MQQLQIEFFWPLTEQLPLDLDYSECAPHLYYLKAQGQPREGPFATGMVYASDGITTTTTSPTWGTVGATKIKTTELTIETPNMPWYRKAAYKIMGFKWE